MIRFPSFGLSRLQGTGRRLRRSEEGATAVEFALVAPLFFALTFAFFEAGFYMLRQTMLHAGVDKVVRDLRVQPRNVPIQRFIDDVCDQSLVLGGRCREHLVVELYTIEDDASDYPTGNAPCADRAAGPGSVRPVTQFDPSQQQRLVFLRACMVVDPLIPGIGLATGMVNDPTGGIRMISTSAYMSEG